MASKTQYVRPAVKLEEGCRVSYRSSQTMKAKEDIHFSYDAKNKWLKVGLAPDLIIPLAKISRQKARNYVEGTSFAWALLITIEGTQHSFTYESQQERDFWDDEISSFRRGIKLADLASTPVPGTYWAVKRVEIKEPQEVNGEKIAVRLVLDLAVPGVKGAPPKTGLDLIIYEETTPEKAKEQVIDFAKSYNLLPTEGTSLYRLVKALRQRQQVLRETQNLMSEIQAEHYLERKEREKTKTSADIASKANSQLLKIAETIPDRLGRSGCGAQFVSLILARNIEKLRVINDMIAKLEGEQVRTSPRPGTMPKTASGSASPKNSPRSPRNSPRQPEPAGGEQVAQV